MILGDQYSFPLHEACATLWWPCVCKDFRSDKTFAFGPIATCRETGSWNADRKGVDEVRS